MELGTGSQEVSQDRLSTVFAALADPIRRQLLARLAEGDANVGELCAPFAVSQPAISRHLKVLEQAGLITRTRQATARLSHLEAEPLREATAWLTRYREYWEEAYERLDTLLVTLQGPASDGSTSSTGSTVGGGAGSKGNSAGGSTRSTRSTVGGGAGSTLGGGAGSKGNSAGGGIGSTQRTTNTKGNDHG